jgi:hypothetical protein
VQRPELEASRAITTVELAPPGWPEDVTEVTIKTFDGRTLVARHDVSRPSGDLPSLRRTLRTKFRNLVGPRLGPQRADDLMGAIEGFATQGEVAILLAGATHYASR